MNSIKSDLVSLILDYLPKEEIKENIGEFYSIDSEWRIAMYRHIKKQKIHEYFDLGREYNKKFSPFSQATFGEVVTNEQKKNIIEEFYEWISNILGKKVRCNKNTLTILLKEPILNIEKKNIITHSWYNFFIDFRNIVSMVPFALLIDKPIEIGFQWCFKKTEKDFNQEPESINNIKRDMRSSWSLVHIWTENEDSVRYHFNPDSWEINEQVVSFMEKRPARNTPYTENNYIIDDSYIEDDGFLSKNAIIHTSIFAN